MNKLNFQYKILAKRGDGTGAVLIIHALDAMSALANAFQDHGKEYVSFSLVK